MNALALPAVSSRVVTGTGRQGLMLSQLGSDADVITQLHVTTHHADTHTHTHTHTETKQTSTHTHTHNTYTKISVSSLHT